MLDFVPPQIFLLILLAVFIAAPAGYIVDHIRHDPARRDITLPPEDLEWRTARRLATNVLLVAVAVFLAIFSFTSAASDFARSEWFPFLFGGALGLAGLAVTAWDFSGGKVTLFLKGLSKKFDKDSQPKRFWAGVVWNVVISSILLAVPIFGLSDQREARCRNNDNDLPLSEQIEACDAVIADFDGSSEDLSDYYAERGIAYANSDRPDDAIADYSEAIMLDPSDHYSLYNRALAYEEQYRFDKAIDDYSAAIAVEPAKTSAYERRGFIEMNIGRYRDAAESMTGALEHDSGNMSLLGYRGAAYAFAGDYEKAESDFDAVAEKDPTQQFMLRGRAVLADRQLSKRETIARLTEVLKHYPNDQWALQRRADLYWEMGLKDEAAADDDRIGEMLEERSMAKSE